MEKGQEKWEPPLNPAVTAWFHFHWERARFYARHSHVDRGIEKGECTPWKWRDERRDQDFHCILNELLEFSPLLHETHLTLSITNDINGAEEMAYQIKALAYKSGGRKEQLHKLALCLHRCTVVCTCLHCLHAYTTIINKMKSKNIKGKRKWNRKHEK